MKSIQTTLALGLALLASTGAAMAHGGKATITSPTVKSGDKALVKLPGHHANLISQNKIKALLASGKISDTKTVKDGWKMTGKGTSGNTAM